MTTPFPFVASSVLTAQQLNDIQNLPISDKTASYVLIAGDETKRTMMNNASSTTITVNNSIFTVGDVIQVANKGAGTCTITAGAGVTINTSGNLALAQYGGGYLLALSASTFTFFNLGGAAQLTVNYLVIAGGGGSGENSGGGGGAGGLRSSVASTGGGGTTETSLTLLKSTNYLVNIGAGGAVKTQGSTTIFSSIQATGGGAGANRTAGDQSGGSTGGSGGGGGGSVTGTRLGFAGTANQGFAGGNGLNILGGGGGGSGAIGGNAVSTTGGAGGNGSSNNITGSSVTRASGGGGGAETGTGGTAPAGGGGNGGTAGGPGTAGTANTGGGGGGGPSAGGGAGGSGVVILSFPTAGNTLTVGVGLTSSSTTSGANTVVTITAGNGTVSWA